MPRHKPKATATTSQSSRSSYSSYFLNLSFPGVTITPITSPPPPPLPLRAADWRCAPTGCVPRKVEEEFYDADDDVDDDDELVALDLSASGGG